jgi:hypothetical protein
VPQLSDAGTRALEADLEKSGLKIIRSPDRDSGWEDAYAAFANAFLRTGATLTASLLHIDIPNMLFNFSLRNGWFPHLTLLTEGGVPSHLLSPKRVPIEHFATTGGSVFKEVHNKQQQLGWYRERIRPAVLEWSAKAAEQRINDPHNQFPEQSLDQAKTEPPGGPVADMAFPHPPIAAASPQQPKANAPPRKRKARPTKLKWPTEYRDGTETPRGILDRRRVQMHLEWRPFHKLVENKYAERESQRWSSLKVDPPRKTRFGKDSLESIRRGKNLPPDKLQAVAAVISIDANGRPIPIPIQCEMLLWRDGFVPEALPDSSPKKRNVI